MAQGSLAETETLLILAHRLGYLPAESQRDLQDRASEIGRMLSGLTKSLRSKR